MFIYKYFLIISGFIHYVSGVPGRHTGRSRLPAKESLPARVRRPDFKSYAGVASRGRPGVVHGRVAGRGHGRGGGRGDGRAGGDTPRPVVDKPLTMESLLQQRLSSFEPNEEMKGWVIHKTQEELLAEYNTAIAKVENLKLVDDPYKLGVFSILCKSGQTGTAEDKCPILNPDSPAVAEMYKLLGVFRDTYEGSWEIDDVPEIIEAEGGPEVSDDDGYLSD